ncbi:hypothetical protein HYU11_06005 [Candidatus Woesearchaeota archaeon]|nr:hypothetical protein [Candidatus Woesearchaeota archaeon]
MVAFLDGLVGRVREMLPVVSRAYHEGIVSEMSALHRQEINSTNDRVATLNDGFKAMSDDYSSRIGQLEKRLDEAKKANLRLYTELEDARAGLEDRSNRIFDLESRLNDWETAFSLVNTLMGIPLF